MKKIKIAMVSLLVIMAISSAILCYADENIIDESKLNGYYVPPDSQGFINGYGIIQDRTGYSRSMLFGLIDTNYNVVVEPEYYWIEFDPADKNIIYGYMDIYFKYGDIYIKTDGGLNKINSEMYHMSLDFSFPEQAGNYGNYTSFSGAGLLVVSDKNYKHYGVIDKTGDIVLPFTDEYYYMIVGEWIIQYEILDTKELNNTPIIANGEIINIKGEVLTKSKYDNIEIIVVSNNGDIALARVTKNGKLNLLDLNTCNELFDWTNIKLNYKDNYIIAQNSDGEYGLFDLNGNTVIDFGLYIIGWNEDIGFYTVNESGYPDKKIKIYGETVETEEIEKDGPPEMYMTELNAYLPSIDITLNGIKIENRDRLYPFISYGNITYFPMTYYDSRFLNLKTEWDSAEGLKITKSDEPGEYITDTSAEINPYSVKVYAADFDIYVNGKKINNLNEPYPLLIYNNLAYFPITWKFAVDEFGWEYYYSNEEGLKINSR